MNYVLLPTNTSSQQYHQRLTHPTLGQMSGFTNSMHCGCTAVFPVESDSPAPFQSPGHDVVLLLRLTHVNESLSSPVVCDLCTLPHLILW